MNYPYRRTLSRLLLILIGAFLVGKAFVSWDLMFGVVALYLANFREY